MKCTRTERKFKVDFLENKASNEKFLFYIFDFFFRVESPPFRLYHQLPTTLYMIGLRILKVGKMQRAHRIWRNEKEENIQSEVVLVITFNGKNKPLLYYLLLHR